MGKDGKPNGCGPSWLPSWAWPDFGFTVECNDVKNQFSADSLFMVEMNLRVGKQRNIPIRILQALVVPVNHLFVRVGGWASFKRRNIKEIVE
jgi:hypothetical protein